MHLNDLYPDLEARFVRYVQISTASDEDSPTAPSTGRQFDLLRLLADELEQMGAQEVELTAYGCVFATIPATTAGDVPTIGLFAHVDTSPAFSGEGVKPLIHRQYNGQPLVLPDDPSQVINPADFPYLAQKVGDDIITASGTTLLGADDKAGVAILMSLATYLLAHPEIPHGKLRLCFNPDEEIGRGVINIDLQRLGADFAYTFDGGVLGEVEYETFSANKAIVKVTGVSAHPGYAKGVMVNALHLAAKILEKLPQDQRTPETTSGREGFIHAYELNGGAAQAELRFILRDFELEGLEAHGQLLKKVCAEVQAREPRAQIQVTITPQYRNMRYWLEKDMTPVELALEATRRLGIEPIVRPIRGGTDGARLTEMGLPTPNLFTGMQNFHGPLEWVSLQDMHQAVQMALHLVQLWAEKAGKEEKEVEKV